MKTDTMPQILARRWLEMGRFMSLLFPQVSHHKAKLSTPLWIEAKPNKNGEKPKSIKDFWYRWCSFGTICFWYWHSQVASVGELRFCCLSFFLRLSFLNAGIFSSSCPTVRYTVLVCSAEGWRERWRGACASNWLFSHSKRRQPSLIVFIKYGYYI